MCSVMYLEWRKHSSCNVNMCRDSILHADVKCSLQGKSKFAFWKTGTIKTRCKIISTRFEQSCAFCFNFDFILFCSYSFPPIKWQVLTF